MLARAPVVQAIHRLLGTLRRIPTVFLDLPAMLPAQHLGLVGIRGPQVFVRPWVKEPIDPDRLDLWQRLVFCCAAKRTGIAGRAGVGRRCLKHHGPCIPAVRAARAQGRPRVPSRPVIVVVYAIGSDHAAFPAVVSARAAVPSSMRRVAANARIALHEIRVADVSLLQAAVAAFGIVPGTVDVVPIAAEQDHVPGMVHREHKERRVLKARALQQVAERQAIALAHGRAVDHNAVRAPSRRILAAVFVRADPRGRIVICSEVAHPVVQPIDLRQGAHVARDGIERPGDRALVRRAHVCVFLLAVRKVNGPYLRYDFAVFNDGDLIPAAHLKFLGGVDDRAHIARFKILPRDVPRSNVHTLRKFLPSAEHGVFKTLVAKRHGLRGQLVVR